MIKVALMVAGGLSVYVCWVLLVADGMKSSKHGRTCPRPPKRVVVRGVQVGQFQPAPRNRHGAN